MESDAHDTPVGVTLEEVRLHVARIFTERTDDPLKFSRVHGPEVVIDGFMYRFPMQTTNGGYQRVVTVYINPGNVGRQFWMQEFRTLVRIGDAGHSALPQVHDGGFDIVNPLTSDGVAEIAYIEAGSFQANLGELFEREWFRRDRSTLFRSFLGLADALVTLHRDGLLHRNIQPSSIAVEVIDGEDDRKSLRLTGFEQSALLSDLLRRGVEFADDNTAAAALAKFIDSKKLEDLACMPPERLEFLFLTEVPEQMPEQMSGDVYALGIVAYQCFVAEIDPMQLHDVFPPREINSRSRTFNRAAWSRFHADLESNIRKAEVGPTLRAILSGMVQADPDRRFGSLELLKELRRHDMEIVEELCPSADEQIRLVAIEPTLSEALQRWGWISPIPLSSREGREELLEFLNEDLRDAWLEYAPEDLPRFIARSDAPVEMRKSKYALRGRLGFYYGQLYQNRNPRSANEPTEFEHVFFIKFALQRELLLKHSPERQTPRHGRRVSPLRVVDRTAEEVMMPDGSGYPSWRPEMERARVVEATVDSRRSLNGALRWLIAYQNISQEARRYPFVREDETDSPDVERKRRVRLRFDAKRDAQWRSREALRNQFMLNEDRRPRFDDFFASREDRNFDGTVRWWPDIPGSILQRGFGEVETVEPDCITVQIGDGQEGTIPAIGWISPADDDGQNYAFERQREAALEHLAERPMLTAKLIKPTSLLRHVSNSEGSGADLLGARSRNALRRMLAADSIYVLQGPPGTGKTTVVARAVAKAIHDDPSIRILVSAQSHYALDNLAQSIRKLLPEDAIGVRLASQASEGRVAEELADWTRKALIEHRPSKVTKKVKQWLADPLSQPELRPIVEQWLSQIKQASLEIVDRTRRGANVVFATCVHASETNRIVPGRAPDFDWVVIEEAAKAHPTELIIPLIRGARWTLVGDHKQLPPYQAREIKNFLLECMPLASEDEGIATLVEGAEEFPKYFNLFEGFFTRTPPIDASAAPRFLGREKRPVDALDLQFRMLPSIGAVIRDAFYPGALSSQRTDDGAPLQLKNGRSLEEFGHHRLIWLNTDDDPLVLGDGSQSLGEALAIRQLTEKLWTSTTPAADELAILTPYRRQRDLMLKHLPARFHPFLHTVDSFQGREARVVLVSLVRGYMQKPPRHIFDRIGHLADHARTNVLLSRARDLMVLIGQFSHFRDAGQSAVDGEPGSFWTTVCHHFSSSGQVSSAKKVLGTGTLR